MIRQRSVSIPNMHIHRDQDHLHFYMRLKRCLHPNRLEHDPVHHLNLLRVAKVLQRSGKTTKLLQIIISFIRSVCFKNKNRNYLPYNYIFVELEAPLILPLYFVPCSPTN